ncbi:MAG: YceI family protein [Sumerlaeia bacterium]
MIRRSLLAAAAAPALFACAVVAQPAFAQDAESQPVQFQRERVRDRAPSAPGEAQIVPGEQRSPRMQRAQMLNPGKLEWSAAKVNGSGHTGGFERWTFKAIEMPGDTFEGGSATLEVDLTSLTSDNDKLTGHLQSADFFDVEKFPKATVKIHDVKADPEAMEGQEKYVGTATVSLLGLEKPAPVSFDVTRENNQMTIKGKSELRRADYEMYHPYNPDDPRSIAEPVTVTFESTLNPRMIRMINRRAQMGENAEQGEQPMGWRRNQTEGVRIQLKEPGQQAVPVGPDGDAEEEKPATQPAE